MRKPVFSGFAETYISAISKQHWRGRHPNQREMSFS